MIIHTCNKQFLCYFVYTILFSLISTCAYSGALGVQANATIGTQEPNVVSPWLHAKLHIAKTHVLIGEPIWLTFSIENAGDECVTIVRCAPVGSDYLNYEIVAPNQQPRTFKPRGILIGTGVARPFLVLQPSDVFSRSDELTCEANGLLMNTPGEYMFHAFYSLPDGMPGGPQTIRSNGVCVIAEEPRGIDKAVYDLLLERITNKSKTGGFWSVSVKSIPEYESIIAKYPRSKYTTYIRYYLAQALETYALEKAQGQREIIAFFEKAAANYKFVADSLGDAFLGVYARKLEGRCYASLGKPNIAEEKFLAAFSSSGVTTEEQIEILSWARDPDYFYRDRRLALFRGDVPNTSVMFPLLPYAHALGYEFLKDGATGETTIMRGDYKWVVKIGASPLTVCGTLYKDMRVEKDINSGFNVSPSVIAMLMAERYGEDMIRQLSFMLTPVQGGVDK